MKTLTQLLVTSLNKLISTSVILILAIQTTHANQHDFEFRQVGQASYTKFLFWDIFEAYLYLSPQHTTEDYGNSDIPVKLRLKYYRELSSSMLIEAAEKILNELYGSSWISQYDHELFRLNASYQSVSKDDEYTLTYIPGNGMTLALNGIPKVTVHNDQFSRDYLQIWLGAHYETVELSNNLLGK